MACTYSASRVVDEVDGQGRADLNVWYEKLREDTIRADTVEWSDRQLRHRARRGGGSVRRVSYGLRIDGVFNESGGGGVVVGPVPLRLMLVHEMSDLGSYFLLGNVGDRLFRPCIISRVKQIEGRE